MLSVETWTFVDLYKKSQKYAFMAILSSYEDFENFIITNIKYPFKDFDEKRTELWSIMTHFNGFQFISEKKIIV